MDIQSILAEHKKWLADPSTGARAGLQGANLRNANLRNADLRSADLRSADLRSADLRNANLQYANLQYAGLQGADLRNANLQYANLQYANLQYADLRNANLQYAVGVVYLTQTDAGYLVLAQQAAPEAPWRIRAGCRDFSIAEARAHWGTPGYHTPISGRRVVAVIDWFERELAARSLR